MSKYYIYNGTVYNQDELKHGYKYIKKEPDGKGGWRYYYKISNGRNGMMAQKTETYGSKDSDYGVYKNDGPGGKHTTIKRRVNTLIGQKYTVDNEDGSKTTYDNDGIIAQAVHDTKKSVKRGQKKIKKLLKRAHKKIYTKEASSKTTIVPHYTKN